MQSTGAAFSRPVAAIARLVERWRLGVEDIDYVEINEAFAMVNLRAKKVLD